VPLVAAFGVFIKPGVVIIAQVERGFVAGVTVTAGAVAGKDVDAAFCDFVVAEDACIPEIASEFVDDLVDKSADDSDAFAGTPGGDFCAETGSFFFALLGVNLHVVFFDSCSSEALEEFLLSAVLEVVALGAAFLPLS
jgi:hypothetical protein